MSLTLSIKGNSEHSVPFFGTLRGILFLIWSQAAGKSFLKAYLLPFVSVFAVTFLLALEPNQESFEGWIVDLFLLIALPLIALSVSGGLLRDEIKDATLEYLWTRPVSRFRLILGFYIGAVIKTLFYGILFVVAIWTAGILKGSSPDIGMLPGFIAALLFSTITYCAGGLFLAALTGKFMVAGIGYGVAIEVGFGRISGNLSALTIKHYIVGIGGFSDTMTGATAWQGYLVCSILSLLFVLAAGLLFSVKAYNLGSEE